MKKKLKRSRFAQKRIDYIVYGNPVAARKLLRSHGYQPPGNIHDLLRTIKMLIKKEGRKIVRELVRQHPDKRIILRVHKDKQDSYCSYCGSHAYNNYCGSCGHVNYSGDQSTAGMSIRELEDHYENMVSESNEDPGNEKLAKEVQNIWNELRKRKSNEKEKKAWSINVGKQEIILYSSILATGLLIGTLLSKKTANKF